MWTEKHKPKNLSGFVGNNKVVSEVAGRSWSKPLMVYGGHGVGKTLLAHILADELGFELISVDEVNIDSALGMCETTSLYGKQRLIFVDNIDEFKRVDKVVELVKGARNPVVLTADDIKSKKAVKLKPIVEAVCLKRPHPAVVAKHLADIASAEGIEAEREVFAEIAKRAAGDIRAAVLDLQSVAQGRGEIRNEDLEVLSDRNRATDVYKVLSKIFGGRDLKRVVESTWDLAEEPRNTILWVDENVPRVYTDSHNLGEALGSLSRADVFLGRIMRRQHWGFLRYANALMTAGVNAARPEKINFTPYQFPRYIAAMGRTRKARSFRKSIGSKLSPVVHASAKVVARQYVPLYRVLLNQKRVCAEELSEAFDLNEEEIEYISG